MQRQRLPLSSKYILRLAVLLFILLVIVASVTGVLSEQPLDLSDLVTGKTITSGSSISPPPQSTTTPLTPARQHAATFRATGRVLWGMWLPDWVQNGVINMDALARRETMLHHRIDVISWYADWTESWEYDGGLVKKVIAIGRIPMITWEARNRPLSDIAAGKFDAYIDSWALGIAAAAPTSIYIRIFDEFNDNTSYPWQITKPGNTPAVYKAAWRHIHDRFVEAHATNVQLTWNPDGPDPHAAQIRSAYPGDHFVEDAGFVTYHDYPNDEDYRIIASITQRPIVIGEFAARDADVTWLQDFSRKINNGTYSLIRLVVWFDQNANAIEQNPKAEQAVRAMLAGPAFIRL